MSHFEQPWCWILRATKWIAFESCRKFCLLFSPYEFEIVMDSWWLAISSSHTSKNQTGTARPSKVFFFFFSVSRFMVSEVVKWGDDYWTGLLFICYSPSHHLQSDFSAAKIENIYRVTAGTCCCSRNGPMAMWLLIRRETNAHSSRHLFKKKRISLPI